MFSDSDRNVEYNEAESTIIQLSDEGSFCDTDTVVIDQNTVTITDEGTYLLSGSPVIRYAHCKMPKLQMKYIWYLTRQPFPIRIRRRSILRLPIKCFLRWQMVQKNAVSNGGVYADIDEDTIDGAIFSKADLLFNGTENL